MQNFEQTFLCALVLMMIAFAQPASSENTKSVPPAESTSPAKSIPTAESVKPFTSAKTAAALSTTATVISAQWIQRSKPLSMVVSVESEDASLVDVYWLLESTECPSQAEKFEGWCTLLKYRIDMQLQQTDNSRYELEFAATSGLVSRNMRIRQLIEGPIINGSTGPQRVNNIGRTVFSTESKVVSFPSGVESVTRLYRRSVPGGVKTLLDEHHYGYIADSSDTGCGNLGDALYGAGMQGAQWAGDTVRAMFFLDGKVTVSTKGGISVEFDVNQIEEEIGAAVTSGLKTLVGLARVGVIAFCLGNANSKEVVVIPIVEEDKSIVEQDIDGDASGVDNCPAGSSVSFGEKTQHVVGSCVKFCQEKTTATYNGIENSSGFCDVSYSSCQECQQANCTDEDGAGIVIVVYNECD